MSTERRTLERAIIAGFFILLSAVGGYAFNAIDKRMANSEARIIALEQSSSQKREKLATLETKQVDIERRLDDIQRGIDLLIRMHMQKGGS